MLFSCCCSRPTMPSSIPSDVADTRAPSASLAPAAPSTSSAPRLSESPRSSTPSMSATEPRQMAPSPRHRSRCSFDTIHLFIGATAPVPRPSPPRLTPPRPRQPRHPRHCSSDTTCLCTTRRHVSGEFPRRLCTASSCLRRISTTARSPAPNPLLCSDPPPPRIRRACIPARVPPAHPTPTTLAKISCRILPQRPSLPSVRVCARVCQVCGLRRALPPPLN